jgi:TolA-binding protein
MENRAVMIRLPTMISGGTDNYNCRFHDIKMLKITLHFAYAHLRWQFRVCHGCLFCLIIMLVMLPSIPSIAGSKQVIDSEKQFQFAEYYFSNKDYDRAIGEYQRYIYYFPEDEKVEQAMHKIGLAHMYSGDFNDAIDAFRSLVRKYRDTETALKSYLWISECHARKKEYGYAVLTLQDLIKIADDMDLKDEALYRMGWHYIEMAKWEEAHRTFDSISPRNKDRYRLALLSAELSNSRFIDRKDPTLAGFLSILPGAGYAYCERYHDAAVAFFLNGGLGYAAVESFDHGLIALGAVITFVELGFYAGNIYGSVSSAHKYNQSKIDDFIHTIKKRTKIHVSAIPETLGDTPGLAVSLRVLF